MHKIEKLLQELCPNGVQWKALGEVAKVGTGRLNRQNQEENGKYQFYVS